MYEEPPPQPLSPLHRNHFSEQQQKSIESNQCKIHNYHSSNCLTNPNGMCNSNQTNININNSNYDIQSQLKYSNRVHFIDSSSQETHNDSNGSEDVRT